MKNNYLCFIGYVALAVACVRLFLEAIQFFGKPLKYLKDPVNWIEIATYIGTILTVIPFSAKSQTCGIREDWQWNVGVVTFMLSFLVLLLLFQKFPKFGIYVVMFNRIIFTILDFALVFVFFWLAFAFGFHFLFANRASFGSWWESVIKVLVMMIGEYEYESLFYPEEGGFENANFYTGISYLLFFIFVVIMSITIMNLLVGLAVDDISGVRKDAKLERLSMRARLVLEIEYSGTGNFLNIRQRFSRKKFLLLNFCEFNKKFITIFVKF